MKHTGFGAPLLGGEGLDGLEDASDCVLSQLESLSSKNLALIQHKFGAIFVFGQTVT